MNIKQKITSAAVIGSLAVAVLMPASSFAAQNSAKIKNNGKNSDNKVKIVDKKKTKVDQSNTSVVTNVIGVFSNTGGNEIDDNSGKGNATINTGRVRNNITVDVEGSSNEAEVPCLCEEDDSDNDLVINGNGNNSNNTIKVKNKNTTKVTQSNVSVITNAVVTASNTGGNEIEDNSGQGDKDIDTGNVNNTIGITVGGSSNTL